MRNLVIKGLCLCTLMACMSFFGKKETVKETEKETVKKINFNDYEFYQTYQDIIKIGDFEYAHEKLNEIYLYYNTSLSMPDEYFIVSTEIYKAEFKQIILSDDPGMTKKLAFLISNIPTECDYEDGEETDGYSDIERAKKFIKVNNDICDYVVSMAITLGNQDLALAALKWYKKDLIYKQSDSSSYYYVVNFRYKSRDAAKKKIDEAIADGML